MPEFDVDLTEIPAFEVGDTLYFKHYFENAEAFNSLQEFYNPDRYRFEAPQNKIDCVQTILGDFYYELIPVKDTAPYCVVAEKGADYSDILRNAVARTEQSGHHIFLMKDRPAVEQATEQGADRLSETTINHVPWTR